MNVNANQQANRAGDIEMGRVGLNQSQTTTARAVSTIADQTINRHKMEALHMMSGKAFMKGFRDMGAIAISGTTGFLAAEIPGVAQKGLIVTSAVTGLLGLKGMCEGPPKPEPRTPFLFEEQETVLLEGYVYGGAAALNLTAGSVLTSMAAGKFPGAEHVADSQGGKIGTAVGAAATFSGAVKSFCGMPPKTLEIARNHGLLN